MNTIGDKIAELRKARGMTQEELSNIIGVSPQTVSKWENSTTMPDIMLLPVIADIFDVSIDALFGKGSVRQPHIPIDEIPDKAYDGLLKCMAQAWGLDEPAEDYVVKQKAYLSENPQSQTAIYSETGAVYAYSELGLIFRKPETGSSALLNNQKADELLKALTDKTVKAVMRHQMTCAGTYYTASSVAKKYGLPLEEVQRALDMLFKIQFADARDVDMGEEQIKVYTIYGTYKMLLVYAIYSLAGRLADYQEHFYGFQGGSADWLSRMG